MCHFYEVHRKNKAEWNKAEQEQGWMKQSWNYKIVNIGLTSEKPSEFQKVYDRLGIRLTERGESFYQKRMEVLVKELEERGLLIEEDGRKLLWADGISIPFTIVKSDGGMYHCRPRIMLFPCAVIGWMCWWRNSRTIGFKLLKTNLVSAISEFAIKKRYPSLSNGSGHKNILQFP